MSTHTATALRPDDIVQNMIVNAEKANGILVKLERLLKRIPQPGTVERELPIEEEKPK